jgi:hypothetical protein
MAGNRDTEIAAAMAQRNHMVNVETGALPRAQVYCFRKSLWAEHLGGATDTAFDEPYSYANGRAGSLAIVRRRCSGGVC